MPMMKAAYRPPRIDPIPPKAVITQDLIMIAPPDMGEMKYF